MKPPPLTALVLLLAAASPALAVDTLQVTTPDPILEPWRWTTFDRSSGLAGGVNDIFEDRDGKIWFATSRGAQRYDGLHWTTYTHEDGLAGNDVRTIIQTRDGNMWFGTRAGGISRFDGETWTTYTTEDSLAGNSIFLRGLHQARDGSLWAGFWIPLQGTETQAGISRFDGEIWTTIEVPVGPPRPNIADIHQASDGSLWFTTWGNGILRYDGTTWTRYTAEDGLAGNNVLGILESRDGSLWFACHRNGISRLAPGLGQAGKQWRTYTVRDGLPERRTFWSLWQTEDGTIWTSAGCRFDGERWTVYTGEQALPSGVSSRGQSTKGGIVWFYSGLSTRAFRFDPSASRWTVYTGLPPSLNSAYSDDLLFTIGNEVWLAGPDGAVRFDERVWTKYTAADGLIDGQVTTVLKAGDGSLWVAGQHRGKSGAARFDGTRWRLFTEADGLVGGGIYTGLSADNGDVWFGTKWPISGGGSAGAMRYDGASWRVYTTEDGLIHNMIYGIAQTNDSAVWFGTVQGLSRFDGARVIPPVSRTRRFVRSPQCRTAASGSGRPHRTVARPGMMGRPGPGTPRQMGWAATGSIGSSRTGMARSGSPPMAGLAVSTG